ncbi:hypothetical protein R1sor_002448 [Riccia sorocarpa]|uniref:Uncharacterized protein n=1 Tax=Riccia sorocarpa TaxID=122646 RepID=A0ABD3H0I3_9MARC
MAGPKYSMQKHENYSAADFKETEIKSTWRNMTSIAKKMLRRQMGPQDSVGNCLDFIRLKGTLAARWRISKRKKFKRLLDRAMEFAEKRQAIAGSSTHEKLKYQVRHAYRQWKGLEKESTLRRLSENLKDTLMGQYHLTEEQAIIQGGLNENIVDTSDDEP